MKKVDHGLGAMGLGLLAIALALLLAIMLPAVKSKDGLDVADWLGFAGSIIGSMVTVIAATVAWFAVKSQIDAQEEVSKRQLRLDALNLLIKQAEIIEQERSLVTEIQLAAHFAVLPVVIHVEMFAILAQSISRGISTAERNLSRLEALELKLNNSTDRIWVFPSLQSYRDQMTKRVIILGARVERQIGALKAMSNQAVEGIVLQITTDQGEDIALFGFANEADNSTNNYSSELKKLADLNAQRMANFRAEVGI